MNANVTTGTRELTAQELDQVTGGFLPENRAEGFVFGLTIGTAFITGVGAVLDWLFDLF
jgi:hypothetical protein